ncbi:MAG: hypothetical protein DHS20C18_49660 [Saprospiraceae bacterium]|nr:MAG: hypothetical protein DHS20C18_49660 [Saprospiraceae bacterium]
MLSHKVFTLLNAFSKKEMTRFVELVQSPYFNKHQDTQKLVVYLARIYPNFDDRRCHRDFLLKKLFPKHPQGQAHLALVFTYTRRLLDAFLVQEQFKDEMPYQGILLLRGIRQRKCNELYERFLDRRQQLVQNNPIRDSGHYFWQSQLAQESDIYYTQVLEQRKEDRSLELKEHHLDRFYMAEKLKDAVEMHIRRNILKIDYSARMLEAVLREVRDNLDAYVQVPAIYIYYLLYQMITRTETRFYYEALALLEQHQKHFNQTDLIGIYTYLQNYCISRINQNDKIFLSELFKLYQTQLKQEVLIEDGYLSEWHYKNIVTTGIRLDELDWVKTFIEAYKNKLSPQAADNAYRFNLAAYYHATGQYGKVLQLLIRVEYSDQRYNLGAKALLLRTYYELGEFETLNSLTDSFRQYLHRNKLMADSRRNGYFNLFRFTRRAAQIKAIADFSSLGKLQKDLGKLQQDMQAAEAIFNQAWLEEKVKLLEESIAEC